MKKNFLLVLIILGFVSCQQCVECDCPENINLQSEICQEDYADNEDYNQSVDNLESQGCDCR